MTPKTGSLSPEWAADIPKPNRRSALRRLLGREWHILRRRAHGYTRVPTGPMRTDTPLPHVVFTHRTPLIRPLPAVRLVYQHNKIANVVSRTDGAVLRREPVVENHAVMMYSPLLHPPA